MKGLVLKDIYNVRFQIIVGLAIMLYPNLMLMLAGSTGNTSNDMSPVVYGLVNYISITVCSSFMLNTISDDYRTGWAKVQRTMPVSAKQIVGAKMLATALIIGFLTVVSLIFNIIGAIAFDLELEPLITMPFVFALLQMITLSVAVVLGFRSKARFITPIYIGMVVLIAAAVVVLLFGVIEKVISIEMLRIIAYAAIPTASAATVTVCCKNGRKAVECDI